MMLEKMPYNCLSQFLMMVFSLMVLVIVSVNADIRDIRILWSVHFRFIFARRQANNFILIFRCSDSDRIELKESKGFFLLFWINCSETSDTTCLCFGCCSPRKFVFVNSFGHNWDAFRVEPNWFRNFRFPFLFPVTSYFANSHKAIW